MRGLIKTFAVIGALALAISGISLLIFPIWRNVPGGVLSLLIAALLGVLVFFSGLKDARDLITGEPKEKPSGPTLHIGGNVHQQGEANVVATHVQAKQIGGTRIDQVNIQGAVYNQPYGQTVPGPQTNIAGNVTGPVLSGNFQGPVHVGDVINSPEARVQARHQLPPPPADFTGRNSELKELLEAIQHGGVAISGLHGMGGIGKTALALKLAEQLQERYPDAQFYLDLKGTSDMPLAPMDAMAHIIHGYDPTFRSENEAEVKGRYLSTLYGQRALLVMDNVRDAAQIEPLIPPSECILLVTSRQRFTLPGLHIKDLDTLSHTDARKLLLSIAARIGDQADRIAELCGYLPLALRVTASRICERIDLPVADCVQHLQDVTQRLKLTSVDASLQLSYELLSADSQRLWRMLVVFPDTFDRAAVTAVWDLGSDPTQDTLSELVRYSLVEWNSTAGRYRLHDLARLFADASLSDDERHYGHERHAMHYVRMLRAAHELYQQGGESVLRALALFDLEWSNVQAGQAWATANAEQGEVAAQLCAEYPNAGAHCLDLRMHPRERICWLEPALVAARRLGLRDVEAAHQGNLGNAYHMLGEARRAIEYHEQHLAISREIGDQHGEATAFGNLGLASVDLGELGRALELYEQQLTIAREIGDRHAEGMALGNSGLVYADLGERRRAIMHYEQHLAIAREIGDSHGAGNALGNLGAVYAALGELPRAIELYEQRLAIARKIGDRRGEGTVLGNLGAAYAAMGESLRAIELYNQRLAIAREIGDRRGEGQALGNLGTVYAGLGEPHRAMEYYQQDLAIAREIGDRHGEGAMLGNLGGIYADLDEWLRAIEYYEQALKIDREISDRQGEGIALINIGLALDRLGKHSQAVVQAKAALAIFEQIEDPNVEKVRQQLAEWQSNE